MGSECGVLVKQANNSIDHMKAASIFCFKFYEVKSINIRIFLLDSVLPHHEQNSLTEENRKKMHMGIFLGCTSLPSKAGNL